MLVVVPYQIKGPPIAVRPCKVDFNDYPGLSMVPIEGPDWCSQSPSHCALYHRANQSRTSIQPSYRTGISVGRRLSTKAGLSIYKRHASKLTAGQITELERRKAGWQLVSILRRQRRVIIDQVD